MKVFIAGVDGYLGWALAQHLVKRGHTVAGNDTCLLYTSSTALKLWGCDESIPL